MQSSYVSQKVDISWCPSRKETWRIALPNTGGASSTAAEVHTRNGEAGERSSLASPVASTAVRQQHMLLSEEAISSLRVPLSLGRDGERLPDAGRGDTLLLADLSWAEPRFQEGGSVAPLQQESVALHLSSILRWAASAEPVGWE